MSIADAMTALAPNLWYKLDEGGGTVANNSGSLVNQGTYSGALDQTVDGVESGAKALRLYAGGQCASVGMDVTSFHDLTIMCWISADASGTVGTIYPVISIGDVTNRLTRGVVVYENHSTAGTPQWLCRWNTSTATGGSPAQPLRGWHHLAVSWTVSDNTMRVFLDGTQINQNNPATKVAALSTDPLLIRSDEPVVIAHVGFWYRALALSEIQSVSNQMAPWPYGTPINTAPDSGGGGGGGGLTPPQDSLLTQIGQDTQQLLSNWAGYTGTTLPSLQDMLNHLSAQSTQIQSTLNDFIGGVFQDTVDTIQQILGNTWTTVTDALGAVRQKAIGAVAPWADQGDWTYPGDTMTLTDCGVLVAPVHDPLLNNFGLQLHLVSAPPGFGETEGAVTTYEERLADFALTRNTPGRPLYTEHLNLYLADYGWLFNTKQPVDVAYCIAPGVVIEARWISLLPN